MTPPDGYAGVPARFKPRLLPYQAAVASLFGRRPVEFTAGGIRFAIRFTPPDLTFRDARGEAMGDRRLLRFRVEGKEGAIVLPAPLTGRLLLAVEPAPLGPHDPAASALLLEFALKEALDTMEAASKLSIELSALDANPRALPGCVEIGLAGTLSDSPEGATGATDFQALLMLPETLLGLTRGLVTATLPPDPGVPLPPAVFAIRIGIARLPAGLVASLRPGDAVIPDVSLAPDAALLVIGEHLATRVRIDGTRLLLENTPSPITANCREWIVPSGNTGSEDDYAIAPEDAHLGELQVILVFELGRRTVPLAGVRELACGSVLDLGPTGASVVTVLANGRRIAQGELVQVGETVAIRLTKVGDSG